MRIFIISIILILESFFWFSHFLIQNGKRIQLGFFVGVIPSFLTIVMWGYMLHQNQDTDGLSKLGASFISVPITVYICIRQLLWLKLLPSQHKTHQLDNLQIEQIDEIKSILRKAVLIPLLTIPITFSL